MLAQAGLTDEAIRAATATDPIMLRGVDLDVTEYQGLPVIFLCRSRWTAAGFHERVVAKESDELTHSPLVRAFCPLPRPDARYACEAELSFDGAMNSATLAITLFNRSGAIPNGTNVSLDSRKLVEHEWTPAVAAVAPPVTHSTPLEPVCSP